MALGIYPRWLAIQPLKNRTIEGWTIFERSLTLKQHYLYYSGTQLKVTGVSTICCCIRKSLTLGNPFDGCCFPQGDSALDDSLKEWNHDVTGATLSTGHKYSM